jgi:sortase (surface protein transpeptidase)
MSPRKQGGARRRSLAAAAITALLAVIGAALITTGFRTSSGQAKQGSLSTSERSTSEALSPTPAGPTASPTARATTNADAAGPDLGPVLPGSRPIALNIPSIDVHSTHIVGLGLAKDGSLEVPRDPSAPGWFAPGPSPGQFGPAVIAGHVDSDNGPAVFYRLGHLRRGDHVKVTRQDGATANFVIDRVHSYQKTRFPTRAVYGNTTNRAELRLITCSGQYDEKLGYLANTVVFAHLTGKR